jgi:hypothetical protein
MPEAGQPTLTVQLTRLLQDIVSQVDAQSLRLVSGSDDGDHPCAYDHHPLKQMTDPKRPWRPRAWRRIVDDAHAGLYVQQLAEAWYGPGPNSRAWATARRQPLKTKANGITRGLQSASAVRLQHGVWGKPQS